MVSNYYLTITIHSTVFLIKLQLIGSTVPYVTVASAPKCYMLRVFEQFIVGERKCSTVGGIWLFRQFVIDTNTCSRQYLAVREFKMGAGPGKVAGMEKLIFNGKGLEYELSHVEK